jgi:hypothetical protein
MPMPPLPMLFHEIVPLDAKRHGALHLARGQDYGFARETNAIPLAIHELAAAGADYPIVFGAPGVAAALAIVGYRDRENLFVQPDGTWRRGTYVPAYARNYPFAFIEAQGGQTLVLGVDPKAASLGAVGSPLFDAAQPTPALNEAMDLCRSLYHSLKETALFCTALEERGLLVENRAVIEFKVGGAATLGGFRVIDVAKFGALDDAVFVDWRRRGWLGPVYAHFHAAGRWARIVDLAAVARA